MTRGATKRRSASTRIAPYQASWFAPPIVVAAPATVMIAAMSPMTRPVGMRCAALASVTSASQMPRVSPAAVMASVTPRRLPSVRSSSRGTASWAAEPAMGRRPMRVASAGGAPRTSSRGIVRAASERELTPAAPRPIVR